MPDSRSDPYAAAVQQAMQQFPWLRRMNVPIRLTTGTGPYMSESYDPAAEENPYPGNFVVQLRNPQLVKDQSQWPSALGREGMDYMARHDPFFQSTARQFRTLMPPQQIAVARQRYQNEVARNGETRSFEDFLKGAELQDMIGGYVFDMPGWRNFQYSQQQRQLLDKLKGYMWQGQTPTPLNVY
jgi:hypothetical protein